VTKDWSSETARALHLRPLILRISQGGVRRALSFGAAGLETQLNMVVAIAMMMAATSSAPTVGERDGVTGCRA
jgi:hypothetical protein